MAWALLVSFVIGAVCALRMPILVFTLVVIAVMIACGVASYATGSSFLHAIGWGLIFAAVLEAGYVFTHGVLFFLYARRANNERTSRKVHSKYSAD
ncbi:hypothetical protein SAMN05216228_101560 [Rhizobium tibeticum]|uniref:Uncharacterized protein n=1 Tax=Rhizobium tibeticum TaxID=501024 RepID=A0A1H8NS64_9HYPH|nr:hypothetical protein [Rhizobium tibeticum]SEI00597.1 hypothetical protein RTCCBAU85039_3648 [Rhizobium tibeticum]SEO32481.1 hypothetical protein SAMN05216228_101560 [Rhizobium tibeticum]